MYSPSRTSYDSALARSTRKSSRGSASGSGSSPSTSARGVSRLTSTTSADAGGSPSTSRPPGAATTISASRSHANACEPPGAPSGPNSRTAIASCGLSPRCVQHAEEAVVRPARHQLAQHGRRRVRARPSAPASSRPSGEDRQLSRLPAVRVDHRHAVAAVQLDDRRRPRAHPPRLEAPVDRPQTGYERGWSALDRHALAAGSFDSSLSACSISVLARSRLPAESSFFTSFSTTRRL